MPKYMIHSSKQRDWYVRDYLVPSLEEQGITDIIVYTDNNNDGNLKSFLNSSYELEDTGGTWHLQDDIIISTDFGYVTSNYDYGIVCGFCSKYDKNKDPGQCFVKDMWYSFPCIRIPNIFVKQFRDWIYDEANNNMAYRHILNNYKGDDYLFHCFMEQKYSDISAINMSPNLVDHIDYLIGGTLINKIRPEKEIRAMYWNELQLNRELELKLNESN